MSIHPNADGSNTEGVKIEAAGKFIAHQLGLALTASAQLTMPGLGEQQVQIQVDGTASVRYRLDGTAPTAAVGIVIPAGGSIVLSALDAAAAKFIQTAATSVLNATFTL